MTAPLHRYRMWFLLALIISYVEVVAAQSEISVSVGVESQDVVVGEPLTYRIQIEGTNDVEAPDLASQTDDFDVQFTGPQRSNGQSITMINGRTTTIVSKKTILDFQLTPRRTGTLVIPATEVMADGKPYATQAVPIKVGEPRPNTDFYLVAELSKNTGYVGEAIYLKTIFYVGKQIGDLNFSMPVLSLDKLDTKSIPATAGSGQDPFDFEIAGQRVSAKRGQGTYNNASFTTLTFRQVLIPKSEGTITIPKSLVSGQVATGRRVRSRSFLGGLTQEVETMVVATEELTLTVKPLPEDDKPANFSGLVGAYSLATTASPTTVNVGDPITLNIVISGSDYIEHVDLPPLQQQQELAANFRIPQEMAPGIVQGVSKRFTQTVRAQHATVTEIPPLQLSYFNTETGSYDTLSSNPIPLTVRETTMVTADDAEGFQPARETVEHLRVNEGIAHNFTDESTLTPQRFGPTVWLRTTGSWLFLLVPPFLFAALVALRFIQARGGLFATDRRQQNALPTLEATLQGLDTSQEVYGPVLDGLREFLGTRLERQASALTFSDTEPLLHRRGVSEAQIQTLKALFEECEAHRYAGASGASTENAGFVNRVLDCARALNKELGK